MQVHSPTSTIPAGRHRDWLNRPRPPRVVTYRYANVPLPFIGRQPASHSLLGRTRYWHRESPSFKNLSARGYRLAGTSQGWLAADSTAKFPLKKVIRIRQKRDAPLIFNNLIRVFKCVPVKSN